MKIQFLFLFVIAGLFVTACNKDDDDTPVTTECDTTGITYTNGAAAIINASCATAGCHNTGTMSTFAMGNYTEAFAAVGFGRIIGAINHQAGFLPMPYPEGTAKLDQCDIDKLTAWINAGALEN